MASQVDPLHHDDETVGEPIYQEYDDEQYYEEYDNEQYYEEYEEQVEYEAEYHEEIVEFVFDEEDYFEDNSADNEEAYTADCYDDNENCDLWASVGR